MTAYKLMQAKALPANTLLKASLEELRCAISYLFLKLNYLLAKATIVPDDLHMVASIDTKAQFTHD